MLRKRRIDLPRLAFGAQQSALEVAEVREMRSEPPVRALFDRFPALARFRASLGNTPLLPVPGPERGARIFAKCEMDNPVGSIKDRTAYALLAPVLEQHDDAGARAIKVLAYSGGSLALALGRLCHALHIPARLVLCADSPRSTLTRLREWGAELVLVPAEAGFLGACEQAQRLAADRSWTFLDQHRSQASVQFHRDTTGAEIAAQLRGRRPDVWVASIGSGATLIGGLRALRAVNPRLRTYACTPAERPYGSLLPPGSTPTYAGAGGLGNGLKQPLVEAEEHLLAGHRFYSYQESLQAMAEFYDRTGMRIGGSSAANWLAARSLAADLGPADTVVTVFASSGAPEEWQRLGRDR